METSKLFNTTHSFVRSHSAAMPVVEAEVKVEVKAGFKGIAE